MEKVIINGETFEVEFFLTDNNDMVYAKGLDVYGEFIGEELGRNVEGGLIMVKVFEVPYFGVIALDQTNEKVYSQVWKEVGK